jgi:uncharacterized protein
MPLDLNDAELDELGDLLARAPAPLQPLDLFTLDGYLAGVLVQPRLMPSDEWLPPLLDAEQRALPAGLDAAWLARTRTLIERRLQAINADIGENAFFDPVLIDVDRLPPASEYEQAQSPPARALQPWVAGFEWALECFPDLEDGADETVAAALARIADTNVPDDLDAAIRRIVEATVELWDATAEQRYAVVTIRRETPKVGRNDPCPCGSGKKFKACHGR